jgi:hypothetical protein
VTTPIGRVHRVRPADRPFVVVRIACRVCNRRGSYRLARLAAKFGPEITLHDLTDRFSYDYLWRAEARSKKGKSGCGVYLPDLEQPRPPGVPPGLVKLRIVKKQWHSPTARSRRCSSRLGAHRLDGHEPVSRARLIASRASRFPRAAHARGQKFSGVRKQRTFGVFGSRTWRPLSSFTHIFGKKIWLQESLLGRALSVGITNV